VNAEIVVAALDIAVRVPMSVSPHHPRLDAEAGQVAGGNVGAAGKAGDGVERDPGRSAPV